MNEKNPAAPPAGVLQPQSIQSTYPTLHTHTNSTHSTPTSLSHVLCSTDIYKVTGPSVMPCSFSRLMSSFDSPENTRVFMPNNTPWVLITHKHRVQLHCYNRDYPTATAITDITFPMPVECLNAPYCILLPDKESLFDQTLVLVTGHGIVLVWSSIIAAAHQLTQHTTHTLTLEQHEQIVAVTHVSSTQAIVGTCKGHLFLLNVIDHGNENKNTNRHGIELSSVAMDRSNTLSDRLSPWLPAALTRLTGVFMKEKSSVLKLIPLQQVVFGWVF
ncbi:hypothetical protein BDF14DRAFT_520408 [Spinellus fusiger]|nr:hypothetical protein BDF14DRAFT_520408 [Spinellus fusiger]